MASDQGLTVRAELFGTVFVLVQNLSRRVDVALRPLGLTSRQWLLLAVLQRNFPDRSPSLTEAAAAYGSSRQNVKRIAEQLARRGYLRLVADPADRRPTRLELTDRVNMLDGDTVSQAEFLLHSMAGLDDGQLQQLRDLALTWLGALTANDPEAHDDPEAPGDRAVADHGGSAATGAPTETLATQAPAQVDVSAAERSALLGSSL
jgi:DNA-binding MarR family transcriptional regulator